MGQLYLGTITTAQQITPPPNQQQSEELDTPARRLKAIEAAFHALDGDATDPTPRASTAPVPLIASIALEIAPVVEHVDPKSDTEDTENRNRKENNNINDKDKNRVGTQSSQLSLSSSAFDSQSQPRPESQIDGTSSPRPERLKARLEAYHAAKASLGGDHSQWDELGVRSTGYKGHVDEEVEL